jgi:hypothetical protein
MPEKWYRLTPVMLNALAGDLEVLEFASGGSWVKLRVLHPVIINVPIEHTIQVEKPALLETATNQELLDELQKRMPK